jgi:hypothetical protein
VEQLVCDGLAEGFHRRSVRIAQVAQLGEELRGGRGVTQVIVAKINLGPVTGREDDALAKGSQGDRQFRPADCHPLAAVGSRNRATSRGSGSVAGGLIRTFAPMFRAALVGGSKPR